MQNWNMDFVPKSGGRVLSGAESSVIETENAGLKVNSYDFEVSGCFNAEEYVVLEYAASGITREHALHAPFLLGCNGSGDSTLCELNDLVADGRRHRIVAAAARASYSGLKLHLTVKAPHARFEIFSLYTCSAPELPGRFAQFCGETVREGFEPVDIGALINAPMPEEPAVIDGGRGLPCGETALMGIPFRFEDGRVAPEPPPAENADRIISFGVPATRRQTRPVSRDSEISVPVFGCAKEIVFAAALSGKLHERWGFCAKDPTILGAALGEVMMPLCANDIERFAVEIVYENGLRDTAFPYNLALGRHVICGETGLYAVRTTGQPVKCVNFRNRMLDTDVSILAVTLNRAAKALIPAEPVKRAAAAPEDMGAEVISRDGNLLTVVSGAMRLTIDTSAGLDIVSLENGFAPNSRVSGAMLRLRLPDGSVDSRFESEIVSLDKKRVTIRCRHSLLVCDVTLEVRPDSTVGLALSATGAGVEKVSCGIIFPALGRVSFADHADGWYLFPKYQNALGNGRISVYEESAPSFPMQFFDLFSPSQQGGLGVLTMERETKVRKYALDKDDETMSAFVEYPAMYLELAPGERFDASPAELFVHSGDWRAAFRRYRDWLRSWYKPYKCQNKGWYRSRFWLTAEITDFFETEEFVRQPFWYDKESGEYAFRRVMEEQKSLYGCYPDILHLWEWTYDETVGHALWGHYGREDFDRVGGLESFTGALRSCAEKTGAAISLYLHPTLLSQVYPEAKDFMPELLVKHVSGVPIGLYDDTFRMCHADNRWLEHILEMYERVYRETGINILYVDEFSLRVDNRCYSDRHGHPVPSNLLETDRKFISALRERLPEEVVLYGEYAAADVNARYIDCNITYHILDSIRDMIENSWMEGDGDDAYGRVFTDLYRFAFPGIVQLVLPMAMRNLSWQPLKSTFFNAEAIYDSFWDAEESRGREFMAKAFQIKKRYADCFISDTPDTMLDSPLGGVFINRFPGKNRTIYTIYNSAYETRRGAMLDLPYEPGVSYYDVWNECPCETERRDGRVLVMGFAGAQDVGCIVAERTN